MISQKKARVPELNITVKDLGSKTDQVGTLWIQSMKLDPNTRQKCSRVRVT